MINRLRGSHYCSVIIACCAIVSSTNSLADGLADFRNALTQLQSSAPITVDTQFKLFGRSGESDELIEREGVINLRIEDDASGLRVMYSPQLVSQLHAEELAKIEDENVKNSALNAVGQFQYWEWRELLYPASQLELMVGQYKFLKEKKDVLNGNSVRVLTFSLPKEKIDKNFRKYVKKYHNRFHVWIDDKGVPLASRLTEKGSGRVFIVVGFHFDNEIHTEYRQHGTRLIAVQREVKEESSGATMQSQRHFTASIDNVK